MSTCTKPSFGLNKFINLYFKDIKNYKQCLSASEERELILEINSGNEKAFEQLFFCCQYIVFEEVLYFYPCHVEITELIQEANEACVSSLRRYSFDKGNLKSFLHHNIYRHLTNFISSSFSIVRYPLNIVTELEIIKEYFENEIIFSDSDLEFNSLLKGLSNITSYYENGLYFFDDSYLYQFDDFIYRYDVDLDNVFISDIEDPDNKLNKISLKEDITNVLFSLPSRSAEIIKLYFGLDYERSLTLEEIGELYNLTRERIRQVEDIAIRDLSKHYSEYLSGYLSLLYKTYLPLSFNISYLFEIIFEDDSYALDVLKNFVKPYRRITSYPQIKNQSGECRRLIIMFLNKSGKPIKADDIKYMIWEFYPDIKDSIITYALNTIDNVIKIGHGLVALKEWDYLEDTTLQKTHVLSHNEIMCSTLAILKRQDTPISFGYLLSRLSENNNGKCFSVREEEIIRNILKKSKSILRTLDDKYYLSEEKIYEY